MTLKDRFLFLTLKSKWLTGGKSNDWTRKWSQKKENGLARTVEN